MLNPSQSASEVVDVVRNAFRAHLPESNAWIEPSNLSIVSTVLGGIAWTLMQEAAAGIDARLMPDTAVGEYLDAIAARPPYNTLRRGATYAEGWVSVSFAGVATIAVGDTFKRSDGVKYTAICAATLTNGAGNVKVRASVTGTGGNAANGMPLEDTRGTVASLGIVGGYGAETDDELRDRLYRLFPGPVFGSPLSIQNLVANVHGVGQARAVTCGDGCGRQTVYVAMQGNTIPTDAELQWVNESFADPCSLPAFVCVDLLPAVGKVLRVRLSDDCGADAMPALNAMIARAQIGQAFTIADVTLALAASGYTGQVLEVQGNPYDDGLFTSVELL